MKRKEFYDKVLCALTAINARLVNLTKTIEKEKVHAFVLNVSDCPKKTESENESVAAEEPAAEESHQTENETVNEDEAENKSACILEEFQPFECQPGTVIDNMMIDATEGPELDENELKFKRECNEALAEYIKANEKNV